jgi:hypothetical protein
MNTSKHMYIIPSRQPSRSDYLDVKVIYNPLDVKGSPARGCEVSNIYSPEERYPTSLFKGVKMG